MGFIKRLFCKHDHAWHFYPKDVWFKGQKTHGLKITVCWQCNKVVRIENYAK